MKCIKQFFCKHDYREVLDNYLLLGWWECVRCGKEKYDGKNLAYTEFKFPTIIITK